MRNKKNRARLIKIGIAVVVILAAVGYYMMRRAGGEKPIIQTAVAERGTITSSVSANGVLQPITTVEVKSNVGGEVMQLAVDEGDTVTAGQLIAKIDPSDSMSNLQQSVADMASSQSKVSESKYGYQMQRQQSTADIAASGQALEVAKQRLAQAQYGAKVQPKLTREAIKQAQSNLAAARAGYNQSKSALVPQMLATAKSNLAQAKSALNTASNDLERKKALLDKGFISKSQLDAASEQYESAKAQCEIAQNKFDTVSDQSNQDLLTAEAKVSQATSALETAKANQVQDTLKLQDLAVAQASAKQAAATLSATRSGALQNQMKEATITQARAALARSSATLKNARTQMTYTTIVAPRSGVVVKKYVEKGSIIAAARSSFGGSGSGVTIVDIADVTRMMALVNVDETDIAQIRMGQKVDISVDAYPDQKFSGVVTKIAPEAIVDQNVTTIPVTVEISNPEKRLRPQMNTTCEFIIARRDNAIMVPSEAITEGRGGATVTVLDNGVQKTRKVQVGIMGNDSTQIASGLNEGESVVTAVIQPQKPSGGMMGGGAPKGGAGGGAPKGGAGGGGSRGGGGRRGMGPMGF